MHCLFHSLQTYWSLQALVATISRLRTHFFFQSTQMYPGRHFSLYAPGTPPLDVLMHFFLHSTQMNPARHLSLYAPGTTPLDVLMHFFFHSTQMKPSTTLILVSSRIHSLRCPHAL